MCTVSDRYTRLVLVSLIRSHISGGSLQRSFRKVLTLHTNRTKVVSCPPQLCKRSSPPLSLYGQLLWREFFYTAATNNPNFDRMEGNPICVQVGPNMEEAGEQASEL